MKNNCFYKIIVTTLFFLANSSYAKIIPPTTKKENRDMPNDPLLEISSSIIITIFSEPILF